MKFQDWWEANRTDLLTSAVGLGYSTTKALCRDLWNAGFHEGLRSRQKPKKKPAPEAKR